MLQTPAATEAVRRTVRSALLVEAGEAADFHWHPDVRIPDFLEAVGRHRVAQVLHAQAPSLDLPDEVRDALAAVTQRERLDALALTRELVDVTRLCRDAGVRTLAVKGPCLSLQTTGDLASRGPGDLDLLVQPADVVAAHRLLEHHGWHATSSLPRPGPSWGWRHLLSTGYQVPFGPGPSRSWPIDLHWQLQPVRRSEPDVLTAWRRRADLEIAGTRVATLGVADALLHSCSHAAKDGWTVLRSLVDIHRLCRRPEVWQQPLRGVDLWSLAATEAAIGLPAAVPDDVRRRVGGGASTPGRVARRAQDRSQAGTPGFPLFNVATTMRRNARLTHSPADVARLVAGQVVPHRALADLRDERAVTAVPRVLVREALRVPRRTREWRAARG